MSKSRILPWLGPGLVLYLLAELLSGGSTDAWSAVTSLVFAVVATVAVLVAAAPFFVRHRQGERGTGRVGLLGVAFGAALLGVFSPFAASVVVELAFAVCLPLAGGLVLDLALSVPDAPRVVGRAPWLRSCASALTGAMATLGVASVLPPLDLFGVTLDAPPTHFPLVAALICVCLAALVRVARRRAGRAPEALASSAWAVLALAPVAIGGVAVAVLCGFGFLEARGPWVSLFAAGGALALVAGHVLVLDASRRLMAGRAMRGVVTSLLTLVLVGGLTALFRPLVPLDRMGLAIAIAALLVVAFIVHRLIGFVVHATLAPFSGMLLEAIDDAHLALRTAATFEDVVRAVLGPLRHASHSEDAEPILFAILPAREGRIDAAGEPRTSYRSPPEPLVEHFRDRSMEVIARFELESRAVRRPDLRPLIDTLVAMDALCVVPCVREGEMECVLVIPRGARRSALTLEEIDALERLASSLASIVGVISAESRAHDRAVQALRSHDRLLERFEENEEEIERLRRDVRVLSAGRAATRMVAPPIAYGPAMRTLLARIAEVAPHDAPVLLLAEGGDAVDQLGHRVHSLSGRAECPLVIVDCATVRAEDGLLALLGDEREGCAHPGWLRLAQGGSLLLADLPALSLEAQHALAEALAERSARPNGSASAYAVDVRVIATTRVELADLVSRGVFDAELARWLAPLTLRLPPLRERTEDVASLVLLAIDRACRVLGREVLGIDAVALDMLKSHAYPWNLRELHSIIDRAVAVAEGPKITLTDLPPLVPPRFPTEDDPLVGTYVELERRVLESALVRAHGNKSAAARLLGLKRTTFLDKLRRHGLEEPLSRTAEDAA